MKVYLDASVVVALLTIDPHTGRAETFLRGHAPILILSDFAAAEFVSAVARRVRTRHLTLAEARDAFAALDTWAARAAQRVETSAMDVRAADGFLRRLDLPLRTPDALNIAIAQRCEATVATFDMRMAAAARALGATVAAA